LIKKRVIPILLLDKNNLVKGKKFNDLRQVADIKTSIKVFSSRDCDEIILLDISVTNKKKIINFAFLQDLARCISVPLTYGGGIKSVQDAIDVLSNGADKVSINTALFQNYRLLSDISKVIGSQSIVASIDIKKIKRKYFCFSNSGKKLQLIDPLMHVKNCEESGCGEILLNSIDRDGTMKGYDINFLKLLIDKVKVPILFAGGAGNYNDIYKVFKSGSHGACASTIFCFTKLTPIGANKYLKSKNVDVRTIMK